MFVVSDDFYFERFCLIFPKKNATSTKSERTLSQCLLATSRNICAHSVARRSPGAMQRCFVRPHKCINHCIWGTEEILIFTLNFCWCESEILNFILIIYPCSHHEINRKLKKIDFFCEAFER